MNASPLFDAPSLRRYDRPGPRYTSYPTALQFGPHFNAEMLRTYVRHSNAEPIPRDLSVYVHVPFCTSPCFYCGCNRIITRDPHRGSQYARRLIREIELIAPLFDRDREVVQLHFGGGTPNFLGHSDFRAIVGALGQHFNLSAARNRDFSIELDPRQVTDEQIKTYAQLGFVRASLGVQDFDRDVQHAVNRLQTVAETQRVIDLCRATGFRSINIDLIYGLPHQTLEGFERTLSIVVASRPERIAVYGYAHLPQIFRAQRQIDSAALPSLDAKLALLQLAIEKLSASGYEYIGMDHFALPDDDLARAQADGSLQRNFMGYTTHSNCDLLGLGVSAISHVGNSFSQNPRDLPVWESRIDAGELPVWRGRHLDFDDVVRAEIIQQLMCLGRVDIDAIEKRFDIQFVTYFSDALARLHALVADDLVTIERTCITATSRGRLLLRIIAMCFDRYSQDTREGAASQYSRAI